MRYVYGSSIAIVAVVTIFLWSNDKERCSTVTGGIQEQVPKRVQSTDRSATRSTSDTITAKVTGYCGCRVCCGKYSDGITSTGTKADTRGCAVDPKRIPYGTTLMVPGYGIVTADDTGSAMRRNKLDHIDLRFRTHKEALKWGVHYLEVKVLRQK